MIREIKEWYDENNNELKEAWNSLHKNKNLVR